jgi:catechol 2,3-dioxygenase-like lactoylglutathione lyase family enzyme
VARSPNAPTHRFHHRLPGHDEAGGLLLRGDGSPVKEGSHENWAGIQFGEIELAFIRVEDYRAPQWPDSEHPKQFHLDFEVDDIEAEQRRVLALGATLQQDSVGPDGYGWRVYTDPIGHPFCLCRNNGVTWTDQGPVWPKRG